MTPRAVLYARVSTPRQGGAEHFSLPVQHDLFVQRCADRGYDPAGEYVDTETGKSTTRDGYQRLLADARAHAFDVIVVRALDRLGRDANELGLRLSELGTLGVRIDAINTLVPENAEPSIKGLLRDIEKFIAQQESDNIAARVRTTMAASARAGIWQGGPAPYGYAFQHDERGKPHLVVDPLRAEVVRSIFAAYVQDGRSLLQIARDLNLRDIPSARGKAWSANTVLLVLARRLYTGTGNWSNVEVHAPAIIESSDFDKARSRAAVKRTLPAGRTQISAYLLSGIIYCGRCGGRMIGHRATPKGTVWRGYVCANHRKNGTCELNYCRAERLEAQVLDDVAEWLGDARRRVDRAHDEAARIEAALAQADARLAAFPDRLTRLYDRMDRGIFATEEQFRAQARALADEQHAAEAQRDALADDLERARLSIAHVQTIPVTMTFLEVFHGLGLQQQKAWLQQLLARVECVRGEPPRVTIRT